MSFPMVWCIHKMRVQPYMDCPAKELRGGFAPTDQRNQSIGQEVYRFRDRTLSPPPSSDMLGKATALCERIDVHG